MLIQTRFDIGEKVFLLWDNVVRQETITKIIVTQNSSRIIETDYSLKSLGVIAGEGILFKTKEELLKSL